MNGNAKNPGHEDCGAAQTDEQLMLAFSRGSRDAFAELFSRYKQPVFGFFRRRIADSAQAEELTQETFLAVLRARRRATSRGPFFAPTFTRSASASCTLIAARRRFEPRFSAPKLGLRHPDYGRTGKRNSCCARPSGSWSAWIAKS
jgi:DNA-directed RNA polymerase specialized sigma24 family protein